MVFRDGGRIENECGVMNKYTQFLPEDDPATVCYPLSLSPVIQNRAKFKPEP